MEPLSRKLSAMEPLSDEPIAVTTTERGMLMQYQLSFNKQCIKLTRTINTKPFTRSTVLSVERRNLSSIRLDEGPDMRTAALIAMGSGLAVGSFGVMAGWGVSSRANAPTVATVGGFGGFITGAVAGFSFSVNRFRVVTLKLK